MKFENKTGYFDLSSEKAYIEFDIKGKHYRWDLKVNNDWADPDLFLKIGKLARELNTKGALFYEQSGGQDVTFAWIDRGQIDELGKLSGLELNEL